MTIISSFRDVLQEYDGFIIDLWGVVHDGDSLYEGALQSFEAIQQAGKRAVILSNAPRRASRSAASLTALGIPPSLYEALITSGEVSFQYIQEKKRYKKCYYLGPQEDADILSGLTTTQVDEPKHADFVYNIGHRYAYQPLVELKEELETLRWMDVPMICANPDIDVIKMDGTRYPCAGELAAYYRDIGGTVQYFGKPYPAVYARALEALDIDDTSRILAIGDNIHTDITGAMQHDIDSLLITNGVLRLQAFDDGALNISKLRHYLATHNVSPTYIATNFGITQ